jgi:hypothetical protein
MKKPFRVYELTYTVYVAVDADKETPEVEALHQQLDDAIAPHDWLLGRSKVELFYEANK